MYMGQMYIQICCGLLLLLVFASSMATAASKVLLLSGVFLPFISLAFFQSSYNCWCSAIDIELYSFLEYFFNFIFPLKVKLVVIVFCCLVGLVRPTEATFTLSVGALLSIYLVRKMTTASKSFSYLSVYVLAAVTSVDNFSHLCPFSRYETFDPESRPLYPYSIRFPRIIWYMTCQAMYPCLLLFVTCRHLEHYLGF